MTDTGIIQHRLINQQVASTTFKKPKQIVEWMVAMQAQEYAMAKWAIGLRLPGSTETDVENSLAKGEILRTHLLRPTWHFVAAPDIRWLLALTAPRVHAANAFMYRKTVLDAKTFKRCNDALGKMLEGGKQLTRDEIRAGLELRKIKTGDGVRLAYLLMNAELEAVICSGARKGNQFTYALLEERVKPFKKLTKDETLAQITERYFLSRGPATMKDFTTWSGLTVSEAKAGIAMLPKKFAREKVGDREYILVPSKINEEKLVQQNFLMPDYDEYGMSYKDRSALQVHPEDFRHFRGENSAYNRMIILNGKIIGTWKRTTNDKHVNIEIVPFRPLSGTQQRALKQAIKKYSSFVGKKIVNDAD